MNLPTLCQSAPSSNQPNWRSVFIIIIMSTRGRPEIQLWSTNDTSTKFIPTLYPFQNFRTGCLVTRLLSRTEWTDHNHQATLPLPLLSPECVGTGKSQKEPLYYYGWHQSCVIIHSFAHLPWSLDLETDIAHYHSKPVRVTFCNWLLYKLSICALQYIFFYWEVSLVPGAYTVKQYSTNARII